MKNFLFFTIALLLSLSASAQFHVVNNLSAIPVSTDTQDKPQSKIWTYAGKHWCVLTNPNGTFLYRLDPGNTWTSVLSLSPSTFGRADCKVKGNVAHILLFRDTLSQLVSVEYDAAMANYKLWSVRPSKVNIHLDNNVETATIDIDTQGRMWLASDASVAMRVRWSDSPYATWSAPITLVTGTDMDDISGVVSIPATSQVGVFWSNQKTKRFGFRTHTDGANPATWSTDEIPASQSALNIGLGMADDHLNLAVANNGTLYAAVKTSYEDPNSPKLALLVRQPNGTWDNLYEVSKTGTRPIVILNEQFNKLKVIYTENENGGNIMYKESPLNSIAFGAELTLINGTYNYVTSMKENFNSDVVVMASNNTQAVSILGTDRAGQVLSTAKPLAQQSKNLTIYPNPFSLQTTISFSVPASGEYELALFDIKGSRVMTLGDGKAIAGKANIVQVDGSNLKSGIYLLKLQTKEEVKTEKLIVTR